MPGMMKGSMYKKGGAVKKGAMKYQEGGSVRLRGGRGPTVEGMAAPQNRRPRIRPEDFPPDVGLPFRPEGPLEGGVTPPNRPPPSRRRGPSYEEDMTPPRGMRNFRSNAVPSDEPMPGRRMKKGGVVKKKAGGMVQPGSLAAAAGNKSGPARAMPAPPPRPRVTNMGPGNVPMRGSQPPIDKPRTFPFVGGSGPTATQGPSNVPMRGGMPPVGRPGVTDRGPGGMGPTATQGSKIPNRPMAQAMPPVGGSGPGSMPMKSGGKVTAKPKIAMKRGGKVKAKGKR